MYYNNIKLLRGIQHRKQLYFHFVRTMSTEYILEGNKSKKFGSPSHKFNSKEGNKIWKRKKRNKARKTSSEEGRSWRHNLQIKQSGFISALRTRPLLSHTHHSTRVPRCFFYFLFFILNDLTGGWVIFYRQIKKIRVKKLGEIT